MPNGDNPKYVVVSLFINEMTKQQKIVGSGISNPMLYDLDSIANGKNPKDAEKIIIDKLREHVKKYGTLEELVISGHGDKEKMFDGNVYNNINTETLLENIGYLEQELGKKITNRIVFDGCSTFSGLNNPQIKFYRDFAEKHNMEIVGSTSTTFAGEKEIGRFVQFTSKGEVIRDKLDTRYSRLALDCDDRSWIDCHLGHTQEEAEKAMRQDIINKATELVRPEITHTTVGFYPIQSHKNPFLLEKIKELDHLTDKVDVLLSKDEKSAVIISSDGMVRTRGDVKLHKLDESEKYRAIEVLERYIGTMSEISAPYKDKIERIKRNLNEEINVNPKGIHFSVVVLDNNKGALLATEDGGYEVINVKPKISPDEPGIVVPPNHKPAPKGRGK